MKKTILTILILSLLIIGCGVNKEYVAQQIADSEQRTGDDLSALSDKTDANATEVAKLRSLAAAIDEKADLAINNAKGFEDYVVLWSGEINFPYDSYDIDDIAEGILNEAGEKMEATPGSLLEIVGHTDASGSSRYNHFLGEKRANSAKRYLSSRFGVSLYRMFILSYGEDKPRAMPDEKNANSTNRRVSLTIWGK